MSISIEKVEYEAFSSVPRKSTENYAAFFAGVSGGPAHGGRSDLGESGRAKARFLLRFRLAAPIVIAGIRNRPETARDYFCGSDASSRIDFPAGIVVIRHRKNQRRPVIQRDQLLLDAKPKVRSPTTSPRMIGTMADAKNFRSAGVLHQSAPNRVFQQLVSAPPKKTCAETVWPRRVVMVPTARKPREENRFRDGPRGRIRARPKMTLRTPCLSASSNRLR